MLTLELSIGHVIRAGIEISQTIKDNSILRETKDKINQGLHTITIRYNNKTFIMNEQTIVLKVEIHSYR